MQASVLTNLRVVPGIFVRPRSYLCRFASLRSARSGAAPRHIAPMAVPEPATMATAAGPTPSATAAAHASAAATAAPVLPPPLLSVAPMMEWTDVFFRQVARLISRHTWLYTEMVVDKTLLHNPNHDKFLWFPPEQHPVVCQLGGSNPAELAAACTIVARYGYDEINLNCGCPSPKVAGKGCFGASLMMDPQLVADCCAAMAAALREAGSNIPVTVKCRLGVDDVDTYEQLCNFVRTVSGGSPVTHFVVHCRKAILGLDPSDNRSVPPLRRGWAFALRRDFPHLQFSVNGQVGTTAEALQTLAAEAGQGVRTEGVMIGRAAWKRPWDILGDADRAVFGAADNGATSRREVLQQYAVFADGQLGRWGRRSDGTPIPNVRAMISPITQLFFGEPGCGKWKREVDAALKRREVARVAQLLEATLPAIPAHVLDSPPPPVSALADPLELEMPEPCAAVHAGPVLQPVPGRKKPLLVEHASVAAPSAPTVTPQNSLPNQPDQQQQQRQPQESQQLPQSSASTFRSGDGGDATADHAPDAQLNGSAGPSSSAVLNVVASQGGQPSKPALEQPSKVALDEQPCLMQEQQAVPRSHVEEGAAQPVGRADADVANGVERVTQPSTAPQQHTPGSAKVAEQSPSVQQQQRLRQQHVSLEQVVHSDWPEGQHEASGAAPGRVITAGG